MCVHVWISKWNRLLSALNMSPHTHKHTCIHPEEVMCVHVLISKWNHLLSTLNTLSATSYLMFVLLVPYLLIPNLFQSLWCFRLGMLNSFGIIFANQPSIELCKYFEMLIINKSKLSTSWWYLVIVLGFSLIWWF